MAILLVPLPAAVGEPLLGEWRAGGDKLVVEPHEGVLRCRIDWGNGARSRASLA
jgi:hypothetical protein